MSCDSRVSGLSTPQSSDWTAPPFLRGRFSGFSGAGTAGSPNSVVCLVLSFFCPRPFEVVVAGASPATSNKFQHWRALKQNLRQTFPFARFGSLRLVKEALALVQRLVVRAISCEWISRVVRRAVRLFRERVGFYHEGGVQEVSPAETRNKDGW